MTPSPHVLVVEDEKDLRDILAFHLEEHQYQVEAVGTGEAALKAVRQSKPDLILLDLMLPGINGLELCRLIRKDSELRGVRIIMVTAAGEESEIVAGLEQGADDYITKPFSPRVVMARVKSVLRRSEIEGHSSDTISCGDLEMDRNRHHVSLNGAPLDLTASEFKVLWLLAENPGRVYTRSQIVENIRGGDYPVTDRSVDVMIVGLRKKLEGYGKKISTVRGIGYRFSE